MGDIWFRVTTETLVVDDQQRPMGRVRPGQRYRAVSVSEHWVTVPGSEGTYGYVASDDVILEDQASPAVAAETTPLPAPSPPSPQVSESEGYGQATLPAGTRLSSRGKRFGGSLLSLLLMIATLLIGYMIWAVIVYQRGQTPAKQLLNMYVIDERTGQAATRGTMFLRGFVIDGVVGQLTVGLFNLVSALWIFSGDRHRRLTDKMVNTIVVDAPDGLRA